MISDNIDVRIGLHVRKWNAAIEPIKVLVEEIQRQIHVCSPSGEGAREIVEHVEIVWVDQERSVDPFSRSFILTQHKKRGHPCRERSPVHCVMRQSRLTTRQGAFRDAPQSFVVPCAAVAHQEKVPAVEVGFH